MNPKKQYYDVISLFLHSKCGAEFYLEFLDSGYEYETVYLAEQLLKFIITIQSQINLLLQLHE